MGRKIIALIIFILLFVTTAVLAHRPLFEDINSTLEEPVVVPDHRISYVVYGQLKNKEDVDFIRFSAKKGEALYIEMAIPNIKGNEHFRPNIAIIGKGIYQKNSVPFKVPINMGVSVLPPTSSRYFYEKFTQTSYYIVQSLRGEILEAGDYYIAIYSAEGGGKYALSIGEKEVFGFIDAIKFPFTYIRVKYFFSPVGTILGVMAVLAAAAGGVLFLKRLMRR